MWIRGRCGSRMMTRQPSCGRASIGRGGNRKSKCGEPQRTQRTQRGQKMKAAPSSNRFCCSLSYLCVLCVLCGSSLAQPKPVPTLQVIPQADDQAAFVREDTEIARYHFG